MGRLAGRIGFRGCGLRGIGDSSSPGYAPPQPGPPHHIACPPGTQITSHPRRQTRGTHCEANLPHCSGCASGGHLVVKACFAVDRAAPERSPDVDDVRHAAHRARDATPGPDREARVELWARRRPRKATKEVAPRERRRAPTSLRNPDASWAASVANRVLAPMVVGNLHPTPSGDLSRAGASCAALWDLDSAGRVAAMRAHMARGPPSRSLILSRPFHL